MKNIGRFILNCALWLISTGAAMAQVCPPDEFPFAKPYFETIGNTDAIPGGVVTAIAQGADGLLWIGTQEGLLRFDGYQFKQFRFDPDRPQRLPGNFITALSVDVHGKLWIGTLNDGLAHFDPLADEFRLLNKGPEKLLANHVTAFAAAKPNSEIATASMWVGTGSGLQLVDPELKVLRTLVADPSRADATPSNQIRALLRDDQHRLWVGSASRLQRLDRDDAELIDVFSEAGNPDGFAGQMVTSVYQDAAKQLWIGTRLGGLAKLSPDLQQAPRWLRAGETGLNVNRVQKIIQPIVAGKASSELWVATTVGLHIVDAEHMSVQARYTHVASEVGSIGFDAIGALHQDQQGAMWIGTWGAGLQKTHADRKRVRSIRAGADANGLNFADVHAILQSRDGRWWFGTGGGGLEVFSAGKRSQILRAEKNALGENALGESDPNALQDDVVIALGESSDGHVLVGTQRGGLFSVDPNHYRATRVGPARTVSNILVSKHSGSSKTDTLWIGSNAGVTRIHDAQEQLMLDEQGSAVVGQINPLIEDRIGRVWAGSASGLHLWLPGAERSRRFAHDAKNPASLSHNSVFGLLAHSDGSLWIATERGIDRLSWAEGEADPRIERISEQLARGNSNHGANLREDPQGRVWTENVVMDLKSRRINTLSRADGIDLGTIWTGASARSGCGLHLHGGTKGVVIIDPSRYSMDDAQPVVSATALRIDGLDRALALVQPELELSAGQRSFAVEFAALDFSAPRENRYRYRLQGFEQDWIATSADSRVASYSNLWPGRYRLEISGSSRHGQFAASPLTIRVRIQPKYWQSAWFLGLCLLAAVLLIASFMRFRLRGIQKRSELLDQQVRLRTRELAASNSELRSSNQALEVARENLLTAQEQLVFQEKMASLGRLVAGVAHEVNTPLGIAVTASSHLQERSSALKTRVEAGNLRKSEIEDFSKLSSEASELIHNNLQRAAALVKQFKQVSVDRNLDEAREAFLDVEIRAILASLGPLFENPKIVLDCQSIPHLRLRLNPSALAQILTNVIHNALLHAFEGRERGQIALSVQLQSVLTSQAQWVEIKVADDGIGMDGDTLRQVFEPFFTTKRNQGGTGLGLHIAFNLATSLGGTLKANSSLGRGSEFILRLPC